MLWTIAVILLVLWAVGLVTSYTMGGFIHVLLVIAIVVVVIQLLQGRKVRSDQGVILRRKAVHQDGAIMMGKGLLVILTGSTTFVLATNLFGADADGIMGPGSTAGVLMLLGLGLIGLGVRGRKKIILRTPTDGRYLALGMREVNLRGAFLFQRTRGKEGEHE